MAHWRPQSSGQHDPQYTTKNQGFGHCLPELHCNCCFCRGIPCKNAVNCLGITSRALYKIYKRIPTMGSSENHRLKSAGWKGLCDRSRFRLVYIIQRPDQWSWWGSFFLEYPQQNTMIPWHSSISEKLPTYWKTKIEFVYWFTLIFQFPIYFVHQGSIATWYIGLPRFAKGSKYIVGNWKIRVMYKYTEIYTSKN